MSQSSPFLRIIHDFLRIGKRKLLQILVLPAITKFPRPVVFAAEPGFLPFAHFSDFIQQGFDHIPTDNLLDFALVLRDDVFVRAIRRAVLTDEHQPVVRKIVRFVFLHSA